MVLVSCSKGYIRQRMRIHYLTTLFLGSCDSPVMFIFSHLGATRLFGLMLVIYMHFQTFMKACGILYNYIRTIIQVLFVYL